jgi:ATP-binding cassette subfamily C protein
MRRPLPFADSADRPAVDRALSEVRAQCWGLAFISALVNILMFAGPLYMLQIYDRVLTSRSVQTLVALSVLLLAAYAFQAILDGLRTRIVVRIARLLDERLSAAVHAGTMLLSLLGRPAGESMQPARDLDAIRGFLSGQGPIALLDLPWIFVFISCCWLIHPRIGAAALTGVLVLLLLTLITERLGRRLQSALVRDGAARQLMLEGTRRHAETIRAMGMAGAVTARWEETNRRYLEATQRGSDIAGGFSSLTRVLRLLIQSALLGLGAWLVLKQEMTAGAMIAASIIAGRALAPVEAAIANWRSFMAARQAVGRLRLVLLQAGSAPSRTALVAPRCSLRVDQVTAVPPGAQAVVIHDVSLALDAGEAVGIIGPSAAGKTALARVLVGSWPPLRGTVRLDGAELRHWDPGMLGRHIGYLPQSVDLFDGTVAENIARMATAPESDAVIRAAEAAGAHEMVQQLPNGYDTRIGDGALVLSAGQRQRIGLARALFGDPFLVVLDEPNSNLDAEGEGALVQAIRGIKARGGIAVVIAHRPSALAACDKALFLARGRVQAFGPRDEVLRAVFATAVHMVPARSAGGEVAP